jgi:hypothetical protein
LSRFYKPRYLPFACPKWDDLKEFIKRDSAPKYLQLRAVQEGGETVYNECSKHEFDRYVISKIELAKTLSTQKTALERQMS